MMPVPKGCRSTKTRARPTAMTGPSTTSSNSGGVGEALKNSAIRPPLLRQGFGGQALFFRFFLVCNNLVLFCISNHFDLSGLPRLRYHNSQRESITEPFKLIIALRRWDTIYKRRLERKEKRAGVEAGS